KKGGRISLVRGGIGRCLWEIWKVDGRGFVGGVDGTWGRNGSLRFRLLSIKYYIWREGEKLGIGDKGGEGIGVWGGMEGVESEE
ncbi:hypothetical protein, partial [Neisseria sicca]|uniref:hypothetical protein n=1 Tax=Neisseria sicca TaxID=490 RepID=UPI001C998663